MAKLNLKKSVTEGAGLIVGGIGANYVTKFVPIQNESIKSAIPIVAGLFLMGQKGMLSQVGAGMIAVGGSNLAKSFGIGDVDQDLNGLFDDMDSVSGPTDDVLSGPTSDVLSGTDDDLDY